MLDPEFSIDSYVVCIMSDRVFKVVSYSYGNPCIPDGWLTDKTGFTANPDYCRPYQGAISVLSNI